jgi:hypothetical protein
MQYFDLEASRGLISTSAGIMHRHVLCSKGDSCQNNPCNKAVPILEHSELETGYSLEAKAARG